MFFRSTYHPTRENHIVTSLFKPSEHDLHAISFHFASRIRWANVEREDYKNIKELYTWSTKEAELIRMGIHMHGTISIRSHTQGSPRVHCYDTINVENLRLIYEVLELRPFILRTRIELHGRSRMSNASIKSKLLPV